MRTEKTQRGVPSQSVRPGGSRIDGALPPAFRELANPRSPGLRNPLYLDFIRSRPCSLCGFPVAEPHHVLKQLRGVSESGIGRKGSDYLSIPVCRRCHTEFHSGTRTLTHSELLRLIVIHLVCFIEEHRERLR